MSSYRSCNIIIYYNKRCLEIDLTITCTYRLLNNKKCLVTCTKTM